MRAPSPVSRHGSIDAVMPQPGDVVAGRYRVDQVLGRSFGLLADATDLACDERVVLRLVFSHLTDPQAVERFRREVRALVAADSPHVARIFDVGTTGDGAFYLVREHVEGVTLADFVAQRGWLALPEAVLLFLQVCQAVQEIHAQGLVLRDLRADHIFLGRDADGRPRVTLTDFGACRVLRRDPAAEPSTTKGFAWSPAASPELLRGASVHDVDARTDVWSLGCILYELLAGRAPFAGEGVRLMMAIAHDAPAPLGTLRADLPSQLDRVIGWALAKDPANRYQSVYALAHALSEHASPLGRAVIDDIGRRSQPVEPVEPAAPPPRPSFPIGMRPSLASIPALRSASGEHTAVLSLAAMSVPSVPVVVPSLPAPRAPLFSTEGLAAVAGVPVAPDSSPAPAEGWASGRRSSYDAMAMVQAPLPSTRAQRRVASSAIAAALLVVPLLVVALLVSSGQFSSKGWGATVLSARSSVTARAAAAAEHQLGQLEHVEPAAEKGAEPAALPVADARPVAVASSAGSRARRASATPAVVPAPVGHAMGTLVVMSVGQSCHFVVDGQPQGVSSSVRVQVTPGVHTVGCKPAGGALRSRSIEVPAGQARVSVFRFR